MKKRILLCEDDDGIIDATCLLLEGNGYDIKIVRSGNDVMSTVSSYTPDIILLDLWLPLKNGDVLARNLKTHKTYKSIPLIIMSAHNDVESVAKEVQADGYLEKPFEIDELENIIATFLSDSQ